MTFVNEQPLRYFGFFGGFCGLWKPPVGAFCWCSKSNCCLKSGLQKSPFEAQIETASDLIWTRLFYIQSRRRTRWKTNGEKMVDFWCRLFSRFGADFFTVYTDFSRFVRDINGEKKTSRYRWAFSRLAFHGLPPLDKIEVFLITVRLLYLQWPHQRSWPCASYRGNARRDEKDSPNASATGRTWSEWTSCQLHHQVITLWREKRSQPAQPKSEQRVTPLNPGKVSKSWDRPYTWDLAN